VETYEYKFTKRPGFLGEGFVHWKQSGYAYATVPDIDLLGPGALRSSDPWVRFAAILEHAKHGDRTHLRDLEPIIRDESIDPTLVAGGMDLLADAGGRSHLELLASVMLDGTRYLKIQAVRSARWAGTLWLIPYMANVLEDLPRRADRDAVEAPISDLLDPLEGDMEFFDKDDPTREYIERVSARVAELSAAAGTEEAAVFAGELVDMTKLIGQVHAQLREPSPNRWADFLLLRHRFEVFTGADCSSFYRDGSFQPLSARVVIEDFLAANPVLRFVPGHRYFFMRDLFEAPTQG
jgi:hypothetical protein